MQNDGNNQIKIVIKMQSQSQQQSSTQQCIFCPSASDGTDPEPPLSLFTMMNQALAAKHLSQSNSHLILPIDILLKLQDPSSSPQLQQYILYRQYTYLDQIQQNMRRMYAAHEFQGKNKMLAQYYKFHKDIPHVVQRGIEKILGKYYDRKREFDYKHIKKLLKQEQGLSITSVEETVTENSETVEQRSRYSTLLNALNQNQSKVVNPIMSDSNLLEEICKEIGKAFPKTKILDEDFKGSFYQNERNFQNYVKKQQVKKLHKTIKASKLQQHFKNKTKGLFHQKLSNNYFNFAKKQQNTEQNQTIKNKNEPKIKSKRYQKYDRYDKQREKEKGQRQKQRIDQSKKKFVYNTNIKIQIQNALFYPNEHPNSQFHSGGGKVYNVYASDNNIRSRKSLVGKINALNQDRYRTPVSKIYQPHDTEVSTRYRKRNSSLKKQRLRTRQSKQFKDNHYQKQRQISAPKRVMSSHILKKPFGQYVQPQRQKPRNTISVSKLKLQHQNPHSNLLNPNSQNSRPDLHPRSNSIKRGSSSQNLRRRSITLTHQNAHPNHNNNNGNKQSLQKMPFSKYASSEMKQHKFKGITIKELLTKKLNAYDR